MNLHPNSETPALDPSPGLSVVIPAFNEEARLAKTLSTWVRLQPQIEDGVELIVADDGSRDQTARVALHHGAQVLSSPDRSGPGAACRRGVMAAQGRRILILDADGPVPPEDLWPLWQALDRGCDVAVGSRLLEPQGITMRQPWYRIVMGQIWRALVRRMVSTSVGDTQCGFKLFTRRAARSVFSSCRSEGFAFHVEILARAQALGLSINELPVRWRDRPGSKVRLFRDPIDMIVELVRFAIHRPRPPSHQAIIADP